MSATNSTFKLDVMGDVVEIRHTGQFDLSAAQQTAALVEELRRRHPRVFVLSASGAGATPEARKFIIEWLKATPTPVEAAVWGGRTVSRAISEMLIRAIQYFRPNHFILTFHATRDDALAWIAEQRKTPPPWSRGS